VDEGRKRLLDLKSRTEKLIKAIDAFLADPNSGADDNLCFQVEETFLECSRYYDFWLEGSAEDYWPRILKKLAAGLS
jgi:hypothetical protein